MMFQSTTNSTSSNFGVPLRRQAFAVSLFTMSYAECFTRFLFHFLPCGVTLSSAIPFENPIQDISNSSQVLPSRTKNNNGKSSYHLPKKKLVVTAINNNNVNTDSSRELPASSLQASTQSFSSISR